MKRLWKRFILLQGVLVVLVLGMAFVQSGPVSGADSGSEGKVPEGVYLELTRDFYEALRSEGSGGAKVYSNDPSSEYLKQISISAKFMVETNLQILRQQEQMIRLLESLSGKKRK